MSTVPNSISADQLFAMPDDGNRYELVHGELRMMSPAGGEHGWIAMRIASRLDEQVEELGLGIVFAAETGFRISTDPDTVRAPDVAFVRQDRIESIDDLKKFVPLAPDLVAEVVSPNDTSSEVEAKVQMWINAGTRMVLVVDPATACIRVYRDTAKIAVFHEGDTVDASDVVDGWTLSVSAVFPKR